jgi:hypothetical protein
MKIRDLFEKWGLKEEELTVPFGGATFAPRDADRAAAWDLYVELMTRIATQRLKEGEGDEQAALASLFKLWELLREALKAHPGCTEFAKLAIPFFNQRLRPFTARWHRRELAGAFADPATCKIFRVELEQLRQEILHFTGMLSEIAAVEDLRPALMED